MGLAEDVSMWLDSRQSSAPCGGTIILSSHYIFVGDIELWLTCFVVEYSLLLQWREEAMSLIVHAFGISYWIHSGFGLLG